MPEHTAKGLRIVGHRVINGVWRLGYASRFFLFALTRSAMSFRRFRGLTFREIAEATGESIDTLTARKRYALRNLSRALRHWIEE